MKISKVEVTKKHLKWVTFSVLVATILFVIASLNPALNQLDQTAFAILNATRYLMLGCFVTLAVGLVWYRENTPERLTVLATDAEVICGPCDRANVWIVTQNDLDRIAENQAFVPVSGDLRKVQIVVIRSKVISEAILPLLKQLKHLTVLDVQGATVPTSFWSELEKCRDLECILATGAVEQQDMKQLHMTLPEAKFYLERRSLVISSQARI